MKRLGQVCSVMAAIAMLFCIASSVTAAEKPTLQQQIQVQIRDFKVERVFISEAGAPDTAVTLLVAGGNYLFNCEISYVGVNNGTCPGGTAGSVQHRGDGILVRDDNGCLAPGGRRTIHADLPPQSSSRVFSVGSHTYECRVDMINGTDTNPGNNALSLTYKVTEKLMRLPNEAIQERKLPNPGPGPVVNPH